MVEVEGDGTQSEIKYNTEKVLDLATEWKKGRRKEQTEGQE